MGDYNHNTRRPRPGDLVFQESRIDLGLYPHGEVSHITRDKDCPDLSEVTVVFKKPKGSGSYKGHRLCYDGSLHWRIYYGNLITVDGSEMQPVEFHKFGYLEFGQEENCSDEIGIETYLLTDFDGCWSSSAGGNARWEIS